MLLLLFPFIMWLFYSIFNNVYYYLLLFICCSGTLDFQNNKAFVASIEARMVCASASAEYSSSRAHIISLHSFIRYTYPYIHSSHLLVSIDLHHLLPSFSPQNHHTHALRKHITNVRILKFPLHSIAFLFS